ncbi:MAG: tetratricopeptide repeat protein, partial [Caldilineaceae bacterium]
KLLTLELRLALLLCFCSLARSPEEIATINDYADELVALAEDSTSKVLCAGVWHFLAKATPGFAQAANAWERSILLAHEAAQTPTLGPEFGVASDPLFVLGGALDFYANRLIAQGAFAQATPLIEEALAVSVKRGFRSGIGAELSNLGLLALLQGNLAQARTHLSKALTITTTNIFPAVHAKTKTLLGLVTLYHNNTTEALRLLQESLELWTDIRDTPYLAIVAIYLAETALWERRPAEAEQWLTQVLRYHVDPRWLGIAVVNCLFVAARLAVDRQDFVQAAMLLGLATEHRLRTRCTLVEPVRAQVDAALTAVQEALGPAAFGEAFAAGQQMTLEEAFDALQGADRVAM